MLISRELIACDHCEYVAHCDLKGPVDSTCPHHYEIYSRKVEVMTIKVAEETNRIIKIMTPERENTVFLTEEDFRLVEYGANQLEISVKKYVQTMFKIEGRKIRRKFRL